MFDYKYSRALVNSFLWTFFTLTLAFGCETVALLIFKISGKEVSFENIFEPHHIFTYNTIMLSALLIETYFCRHNLNHHFKLDMRVIVISSGIVLFISSYYMGLHKIHTDQHFPYCRCSEISIWLLVISLFVTIILRFRISLCEILTHYRLRDLEGDLRLCQKRNMN